MNMALTAIKAGRRMVARGRSASDEIGDSLRDIGESVDKLLGDADRALARFAGGTRTRKAPIVLTGLAAAIGGYVLGRWAAAGPGPAGTSGAATTAVAASRPQPAQSDGSGSNRATAGAKT
jgi:hypothetical protein